jgi:iron complex outermembrane receptor protein
MNSNKSSDELLSYYALDYLKHKATLSISHSAFRRIAFSWSANWQDRAGTYTQYPTNNEISYKPFMVYNLRISYNKKGVNVFADFNNLGNKVYSDLGNIPQSGRWISFGLNYTLE